MSITTLALLSLAPIATVALFLVILRWPASRAMPLSYFVVVGLAMFATMFGDFVSASDAAVAVEFIADNQVPDVESVHQDPAYESIG